jgi:hypothetical protein
LKPNVALAQEPEGLPMIPQPDFSTCDLCDAHKASDAAALALAGQIATAYAPRGIVVRQEKSASDLGRILRGRPITKQEIANRWKP